MRAAMSVRSVMAMAICGAAFAAHAAEPVAQGVVRLSSSASQDVAKDLLNVTFSTMREGADAATVQTQLKQALDAALTEAKKAARPGQVDVKTGNFSLSPRYTAKGLVDGWQGSTELIVEGRDMQAIGALSGRISTLTIARVGYDLSRELREKTEAEVSGRAITAYRAKAETCAKQFGYTGYQLREVEVGGGDPVPRPMMAMQAKSLAFSSDRALPIEPGIGTVTVNVSGTVQLTK